MIRKYRELKKISQEELAEEINISWRQVQRIEQDEEKTRITTFKKIIKALNIPDNFAISVVAYQYFMYQCIRYRFPFLVIGCFPFL